MLKGSGTDTDDDFDLGRMKQLLQRLGNPHTQFKVCNDFLGKNACFIYFFLLTADSSLC